MSLRVNTNVEAFNSHRNLSTTHTLMAKSMEKLSSGLRINRAADDAAGLAISEKMRSQVRGLAQAQRNALDGISLVQTAEGALNEVHSILQRVRELSVQRANGTLSTSDQAKIDTEVAQLTAELTRINANTKFNGLDVMATASFTFQVGADAGQTIGAVADRRRLLDDQRRRHHHAGHGHRYGLDASARRSAPCRTGSSTTINNLGVFEENISAAESRIRDVDVAAEMVKFTKFQILSSPAPPCWPRPTRAARASSPSCASTRPRSIRRPAAQLDRAAGRRRSSIPRNRAGAAPRGVGRQAGPSCVFRRPARFAMCRA